MYNSQAPEYLDTKSYQIYALIDPRNYLVYYVGLSTDTQTRFRGHLTSNSANMEEKAWIAELQQEGKQPTLQILETIEAGSGAYVTACELEHYWIQELARSGNPLSNKFGLTRSYAPTFLRRPHSTHISIDTNYAVSEVASEKFLAEQHIQKAVKQPALMLEDILDADEVGKILKIHSRTVKRTARSSAEIVNCHIRSGIALIYAHWEGYVKVAGNAYLTYIASQRLTYSDLTDNLIAIATKRLLNEAGSSNKITLYIKVAEFFTSGLTNRCNLPLEVETRSNLSSEVLREITYTLGLDYREYETKSKLIDETLLKNRNEVAHGKYLLIDREQFIDLHRTIIDLLDLFSNQISNAANTKAYKRTF